MLNDGLNSKNKIKIHADDDKFMKKGNRLRSMDNTIRITINGRPVVVDDLDIFLTDKPYIKIYGVIDFDR
jgi:hypothetical protein